MTSPPAQAADVAALIARWQREANNFRTVAAEMFEHGDNEEGTLCDVEASRIDTCASELRALAPPHTPAVRALIKRAENCAKHGFDTIEMIECKWDLWDEILAALQTRTAGGTDSNELLENDLKEMLRALGLFDGARPQTPHSVFQECIAEVRRLKAAQPKDIVERLRVAQQTQDDAAALLQRYYIDAAPVSSTHHASAEIVDGKDAP